MEDIINTVIRVPAGNYSIGLTNQEIDSLFTTSNDQTIKKEFLLNSYPRHSVLLDSFGIGKKIVTFDEFAMFVTATGYCTDAEKEGWGWTWDEGWKRVCGLNWQKPFGNDLDEYYCSSGELMPVLQVSWNDARSYCKWMSQITGEMIGLPGEYQWEAAAEIILNACKVKDKRVFNGHGINNIENYFKLIINIFKQQYKVIPTGIIWEWTDNWFDNYPGGFYNKEFGNIYKVLKGGSLMSNDIQKIKQYRFRRCPTARSPFYSFRITLLKEL